MMRVIAICLFFGPISIAYGWGSVSSTTRSIDPGSFDRAAASIARTWEMQQSVLVESALSPSYLALGVRSDLWTPSLSRTNVAGLSVSELKSEKPYKKKDEAEIRRTIEGTYPNAPKVVQDQLLNIFMDVDQRLFEVHEHMQSIRNNGQLLLKYAYPRVQLVQKVYVFEVNSRLVKPEELPKMVNDFDEYLSTFMIRGRLP